MFFQWFYPNTLVWLCICLDDSPLYLFQVLAADSKSIENAIRRGGLAVTEVSCIKKMLNCLLGRKCKLCLGYLCDLTVDEIKADAMTKGCTACLAPSELRSPIPASSTCDHTALL